MKRKLLVILGMVVALAMVFSGCNNKTEEAATKVEASQSVDTTSEQDSDVYANIIQELPEGSAYAFVDMDKDHDALLVAKETFEFEGDLEAFEGTVYGFDADGNIKEYGKVSGGGTANPFTVKDGALYFASHHSASKATIDESKSKMVVETVTDDDEDAFSAMFNDYMEGDIVLFTAVK